MTEEQHVEELLRDFSIAAFEIGERVILGHFGTVQTLLALILNTPIRVEVVDQIIKQHPDTVFRKVKLMAGNQNICDATSKIPCKGVQADVLNDILNKTMGLGQIIAKYDLNVKRLLMDVGHNSYFFWRTYSIVAPELTMEIHELFHKEPFKEIGFL